MKPEEFVELCERVEKSIHSIDNIIYEINEAAEKFRDISRHLYDAKGDLTVEQFNQLTKLGFVIGASVELAGTKYAITGMSGGGYIFTGVDGKITRCSFRSLLKNVDKFKIGPPQSILIPVTGIGDVSDGYHTFNELYRHRAILFSVICNSFPYLSWKSKLHADGTMFENMFVIGINTPGGPATYHYDMDPYWDMFAVEEVPNAPEFDGHTPDDVLKRLESFAKKMAHKKESAQ